jgi:hypothetical protein
MSILVSDMNCNDHLAIEEKFRKSWKGFVAQFDVETVKRFMYIIEEEMRKEEIIFNPISEHGDFMTLKKWLSDVESGLFIDDDGWGCLATSYEVSNINIYPSQVKYFKFPEWATHIEWYNK